MQKVKFHIKEGGVKMYFVNNKKCILNFTLSLLMPIFNICTFSKFNSDRLVPNPSKSLIVKETSLNDQVSKTVNTISDKDPSDFTFSNNDKSNDVQNLKIDDYNTILNLNSKIINNKVYNIVDSMFNKILSLQKIYFLNICHITLEKNIFHQVHNANISLNLSNEVKKYGIVLIRKLGVFVKQNASPG